MNEKPVLLSILNSISILETSPYYSNSVYTDMPVDEASDIEQLKYIESFVDTLVDNYMMANNGQELVREQDSFFEELEFDNLDEINWEQEFDEMKARGILAYKTTTQDYPGEVAYQAYLQGCNLRCGFCHNPEFISADGADFGAQDIQQLYEQIATKLEKTEMVSALVVSGGEPLRTDIAPFVRNIADLGLKVMMETNGLFPNNLKKCLPFLSRVRMDIKGLRKHYKKYGAPDNYWESLCETLEILKQATHIELQLNTTVIEGEHSPEDLEAMINQISIIYPDALLNWELTNFQATPVIPDLELRKHTNSDEYFAHMQDILNDWKTECAAQLYL